MTTQERAEKVVEYVWVKALARGMMILAIPFLSWFSNEVYNTIKVMRESAEAQRVDFLLLQQSTVAQLKSLDNRIDILSHRIDENRYSSIDADKDFKSRDFKIEDLFKRVSRIEDRMNRANPN